METVTNPIRERFGLLVLGWKCPPLIRLVAGKWVQKNPYRRDGRNRYLEFPYVKGNKKGADPVQDAPISCVYRRPLPKDDQFDCVFTGKGAKCVPVFPEFHPCRGVSPLGYPEEFVRGQ